MHEIGPGGWRIEQGAGSRRMGDGGSGMRTLEKCAAGAPSRLAVVNSRCSCPPASCHQLPAPPETPATINCC